MGGNKKELRQRGRPQRVGAWFWLWLAWNGFGFQFAKGYSGSFSFILQIADSFQRLVMTEQQAGGALDWLNHNLELNREAGKELRSVEAAPCDWNDYIALLKGARISESSDRVVAMDASLAQTEWDLIIGSDLVYNEAGVSMLPKVTNHGLRFSFSKVMKALASPKTQIYYAHTKKRYEMIDHDFMR